MVTLENLRTYCAQKKGSIEDFPFDFSTLVFKVGPRMYALTDIDAEELSINFKCDPELSIILRSQYPQITPGYHMNKKHWNTIYIDGRIPDHEIYRLIDHSYELVLNSLKKIERDQIENS
jgi:predicted DNA-binding protein (MmcQ/YjbR family)